MELQKVQRTTLTMKEAAEYLGISYWLINQLVRRKHFRNIINKIYRQNYVGRRFQEQNFENFDINSGNEIAVEVAKDYTNKSIEKM